MKKRRKRHDTIALTAVKEALRRGGSGSVENASGWSVYVDEDGQRLFIVANDSPTPVPYQELYQVFGREKMREPFAVGIIS